MRQSTKRKNLGKSNGEETIRPSLMENILFRQFNKTKKNRNWTQMLKKIEHNNNFPPFIQIPLGGQAG